MVLSDASLVNWASLLRRRSPLKYSFQKVFQFLWDLFVDNLIQLLLSLSLQLLFCDVFHQGFNGPAVRGAKISRRGIHRAFAMQWPADVGECRANTVFAIFSFTQLDRDVVLQMIGEVVKAALSIGLNIFERKINSLIFPGTMVEDIAKQRGRLSEI